MYRVIASFLGRREDLAYVEHEGEIYFAADWYDGQKLWGRAKDPDSVDVEIEVRVKRSGFIRHDPPLVVAKLEDWPAAAKRAREQAEKVSGSSRPSC